MAYTPPVGSAVNFTAAGVAYTAPAGNAVNFLVTTDVPVFSFAGTTTLSVVALGLFASSFSLSSGSTAVFERAERDFSISSGSVFSPKTWLRHFEISSASTLVFQAGHRFSLASGSTVDAEGLGAIQANYGISSPSATSFIGMSEANSKYEFRSRSVLDGIAVFNKLMAMRVVSSSKFVPSPAFITPAAVLITAASVFLPKQRILDNADFNIASGSSVAAGWRSLFNSSYAEPSLSSAAFVSIPTLGGAYGILGETNAAFQSAYSYSEINVPPVDADTVFCSTRNNVVHVVT